MLSAFLLATPATSVAQSSSPDRKFRVLVNVNYNLTSRTFAESSTFTSFLEEGSTARTYDGGTGLGFELGGIYSMGIDGPADERQMKTQRFQRSSSPRNTERAPDRCPVRSWCAP